MLDGGICCCVHKIEERFYFIPIIRNCNIKEGKQPNLVCILTALLKPDNYTKPACLRSDETGEYTLLSR